MSFRRKGRSHTDFRTRHKVIMCCVRQFGQKKISIVQKYEYDVKVSRTRSLYEHNVVQKYDRVDTPYIYKNELSIQAIESLYLFLSI